MLWSTPIQANPTNAHMVPAGPIVYRARVVAADGVGSRPVARFWGADPEGVLGIGETENGQVRFLEMTHAMRGNLHGRGSSSGRHYHTWLGYHDCTPERTIYQWIDLAPAVQTFSNHLGHPVAPGKVTEAAELLLLYAYRRTFGDLPPCNQADPHYNSVEKWMRNVLGITPKYHPVTGRLNVPLLDLPGVPAMSWAEALAAVGDEESEA
ncbi:MAG TPA: hypothetical protein PLA94_20740 [Myxococcota bacterium]|nr:hypothetical protein [Myxococcota bacterium]